MAEMLYFARVRERMGRTRERLTLPMGVDTIAGLLGFLRGLGEPYSTALAGNHLRVAINQTYARPEDPVTDSDEIAIFPPVSGG